MDVGWRLLAGLPLTELTRLSDAQIAAHIQGAEAASVGAHP
jgi:vacuolar-type H+-ATPase subunit B/Vma2